MITDKEIKGFWKFYIWFLIRWNAVSLFAVCTVIVPPILLIWGIYWPLVFLLFFPGALILKYQFGVKGIWVLNDTKDGDFGDPAILKKYGHQNKSKVFKFIWWFSRNHSWNFNRKFKPDWKAGEYVEMMIIEQDLPDGADDFTWCEQEGIHGVNYVAYRVYAGGKVMCRYSRADKNGERQYGAGGNEYVFRI